jgi:probable rRNA maturation factor
MIEVVIADAAWRKPGLAAGLKRAVETALRRERAAGASLTLLLTDDAQLKTLNRTFRGKNKPTNVLSFPSGAKNYLGDIAIAHGVAAREAKAAGKRLADHASHLAVHGVLHLLGYDHETESDARKMEPREVKILGTLGISDPYRERA